MVPVTSWDSNQNLFAISHSLRYNSKMATTTLSHHLLCLYSSSFSSKQFNSSRSRNFTYSVRYKTVLKSSLHEKNTTTTATSLKTPPQKQIPKVIDKPDPKRLTPSDSFSVFFSSLRDGFKLDELGMEIWSIALPAALALAADPIASLVDTAFVGHLGSVELAAVGVSVSVFNLVSKLFNVPLLNITTSFVAEEQALNNQDYGVEQQGKKHLPSVSASLVLAAGIGIAEAVALSFGSGFLMNIMGVPVDSPMRVPAENFLASRAFGAPPIVIALAAQGAFRGFMDTKTPLYAIGAGNLLNAILDPILIFFFHFGIRGAALATVISEYLITFILLWELNGKVSLISPEIDGGRLISYLKSGGLLIGRTIAVLLTMTLATSMAAREGPVPMAGYQICVQVWLTVSLLNDALALAGQALLATDYSQGNYEEARQVVYRLLQIGLVTGLGLAVILFLGFGAFSHLFSTDSEVLEISLSGIMFVAGTQPVNALAFVLDGLYYGVSDYEYAAYSMVLVAIISSGFLLVAAPVFGLLGVWTGLFLFMTLRVAFGIWRLRTKSGPWKLVWSEMEQ
ncbi:protein DETOXIFICATION 44, chloroplastic isoform X2 [Mangifera indica]|uniref:protein DETOXIFICATION 44, chloroplastic isoform X2 n=1 Tax=Mangifera indica TaxID=29780 RepID=UPI001CFB8702|nr:protein DETOXIFICATION 44, chloroplastic isoform X2 [Mangifera indica]